MADTTTQVVTGTWVKVSDSDCTIQSADNTGIRFDVSIGLSTPTDAALRVILDEATTFAYKSPVWVKLNAKGNASNQRTINVVK